MRRVANDWPMLRAGMTFGSAACLLLTMAVLPGALSAEPHDTGATPAREGGDLSSDRPNLASRQRRLADRYKRLEQVLLRLSELSATDQPRRAALLREAIARSKQRDVANQFDAVVQLLEQQQLALAGKRQRQLDGELEQLLNLLLKEEFSGRTESEKRKIRRYLKQINRLIKEQRGVKGRTESGENQRSVAKAQAKVAEKTQQLAETLGRDAAERKGEDKPPVIGDKPVRPQPDQPPKQNPLRDPQPSEKSPGLPGAPKLADGDAQDKDAGNQAQGEKPGEGESEGEKRSDGQSPGGKPSAGPPKKGAGGKAVPGGKDGGPGSQSESGEPPSEGGIDSARKRVEAARKRMREAEQALKKAQRDRAEQQQQQALDALAQAKAELERILRQLREEEIQQVLVRLEVRFRKMLEQQLAINEGTLRLDRIPATERAHDDEIEAGRLGRLEGELVNAANQALMLLHEEGTSVAFPEAVEQMRDEMQQVAQRLVRVQVGMVTQEIEAEIVRSLEETIAALRKALRDHDRRQAKGPSSQGGQPQDPQLVDSLEELRMIRTLQMRVNRRTQRYEQLLKDGSVDRGDCLEALRRLADRQQRIRQATYDLQWGKDR